MLENIAFKCHMLLIVYQKNKISPNFTMYLKKGTEQIYLVVNSQHDSIG